MVNKEQAIMKACREWVGEFNSIPQSLMEKAYGGDKYFEGLRRVSPYEVRCVDCDHEFYSDYYDPYDEVCPECEGVDIESAVYEDPVLPMWGTMWTFGDSCDDYWLEDKDGLQKMAECGVIVYECDEVGYVFGIHGAGYSFYDSHWIPLYKKRGLEWHKKYMDKKKAE